MSSSNARITARRAYDLVEYLSFSKLPISLLQHLRVVEMLFFRPEKRVGMFPILLRFCATTLPWHSCAFLCGHFLGQENLSNPEIL